MRLLDRWLGVPVCAGLTLVRRLGDLARRGETDRPRRILFVKLAEQGATVLADSALRSAVGAVGRENVFAVVFAQNRFILDLLDVIPRDNVITIRTTNLWRFGTDTLRAIGRMRRERVDAAVDMEFFARSSAILSFLSGATARVGFHSFAEEGPYRGDLMTHRLLYNPRLHASEIFQSLVDALDLDPRRLPTMDRVPEAPCEPTRFRPDPQELAEVEAIVKRETGREALPPLILLNANTGDLLPLRRWPRERYVELARRLLQRYPDVCIAFTGAPDEAAEAATIAAEVDSARCVSLGGKTTLRQLLVLYGLAEVMVTNDSGPVHYSALTPMSVVALFGPETPAAFGPRTSQSHVLWAGIACSPCVNAFNNRWTACTDNVCMQRITVDEVYGLVCSIYDERRRAGAQPAGEISSSSTSPSSAARSSSRCMAAKRR
jgi:ADP-heptose:LPS heptosyltransferase